jgi:hypothetical protein
LIFLKQISRDLINQYKNVDETKKSDRCIEIQYSKFHWWWNEDKSYDYYYWIDAGLSHCGLIPLKYLTDTGLTRRYYESSLFNNEFLKNVIEDSHDKFLLLVKKMIEIFGQEQLIENGILNMIEDYI